MTATKSSTGILDQFGRPLAKYDAAKHTRRTLSWDARPTGPNTEINEALDTLRSRHRDLVRNNAWARRAVQAVVNNTVGHGIQAQWSDPARQQRWTQWFESTECDADGLHSGYGLQALIMRSIVESGECLLRFRQRRPEDGLTVPLQMQVLESDHLDHNRSMALPHGGWITQGVEFSPTGQRVAYWLFREHPGDVIRMNRNNESQRYEIDGIHHLYRVERPGQVRGVPWGVASITRLKMLDDYQDAILEAQRSAACTMGFRRQLDTAFEDTSDTDYELYDRISPGAIEDLPPGVDVQFVTPPQPADTTSFCKQIFQYIACDYGITYEIITNDLSEVNFSSARMGWQEFGRNIETWRWQLLQPQLLNPIAEWFLRAESINTPQAAALEMPLWSAPARTIVDPAKEIPALIEAVRAGFVSLPEAIRKLNGYDPLRVAHEQAEYIKLLDALGIRSDADARLPVTPNTAAPVQDGR